MTNPAPLGRVFLSIGLCFAAFDASRLGAVEALIEIRAADGLPGLTAAIEEVPGPGGSRYLDVIIKNTATTDVLLESISLTLPWVAKPADRGLVVMGQPASETDRPVRHAKTRSPTARNG